jgi:hypothetical protein
MLGLPAMPHSAKSELRAMQHSAESELCAMRHSAESGLCAMPHSAESLGIARSRYTKLTALATFLKVTI